MGAECKSRQTHGSSLSHNEVFFSWHIYQQNTSQGKSNQQFLFWLKWLDVAFKIFDTAWYIEVDKKSEGKYWVYSSPVCRDTLESMSWWWCCRPRKCRTGQGKVLFFVLTCVFKLPRNWNKCLNVLQTLRSQWTTPDWQILFVGMFLWHISGRKFFPLLRTALLLVSRYCHIYPQVVGEQILPYLSPSCWWADIAIFIPKLLVSRYCHIYPQE